MTNENIKSGLKNLREGNYDAMRTNFKTVLTEKAVERIEEMKIKVAKTFLK